MTHDDLHFCRQAGVWTYKVKLDRIISWVNSLLIYGRGYDRHVHTLSVPHR